MTPEQIAADEALTKTFVKKETTEEKYHMDVIENFPQLLFLKKLLINHNGIIAGGCFKNILLGEKVKDIDMFFETEADYKECYMAYKNEEYETIYENEKVFCFSVNGVNVELVKKPIGNVETTLNHFDFTITKIALAKVEAGDDIFENKELRLVYHKDFFKHLQLKRLVIESEQNLSFPISTFDRMVRYIGYGFKPCRDTKIKLLQEILNKDFDKDPSALTKELSKSLYEGLD